MFSVVMCKFTTPANRLFCALDVCRSSALARAVFRGLSAACSVPIFKPIRALSALFFLRRFSPKQRICTAFWARCMFDFKHTAWVDFQCECGRCWALFHSHFALPFSTIAGPNRGCLASMLASGFGSNPCIQPSSFTMIWVSGMSVCTISTGPPNSCYASSSVGGLSVNVWIINPLKAASSTLGLSKIKRRNLTEIL